MSEKNRTPGGSYKQDLIQARKELSILYEVSNAMRTSLELERVLHIILTGVTSHTGLGFNRAILFLPNSSNTFLETKIAIGPESGEHAQRIWEYISKSQKRLDDLITKENIEQNVLKSSFYQSIKNLKVPIDKNETNLLALAYKSGKSHVLDKEESLKYSSDILLQNFKTSELVIMPLKAKDKVCGIIIADNLYTQKPIKETDLKIFEMLSNQAGLAIENSQLYEKVKLKGHQDPVTTLWNHGFFQSQLTLEIKKHQKSNQPLSLIMLDLDNFKRFNDSLGHQQGDLLLKEVANILKDFSRDNDYVCRYGGDEFSIILTQTNKDDCHSIAQRLLQKIVEHDFNKLTNNEIKTLTVSIGISCLPEDADDKEHFIELADKAMYQAKLSGKNQICATTTP